jgi:Uma2 family endonuclease
MTAIPLRQEIYYPDSDGQPMAESDFHLNEMVYLLDALKAHFRSMQDVYIAGNMFLYYAEGFPKKCVAPGVFVVKGVPKGNRRSYKLWIEGATPVFVIEVTSESTCTEDTGRKKDIYQMLGVEEYFLHDPLGDYLEPRLQGYRLVQGRYRPAEPERDGSLLSKTLGLILRSEDSEMTASSKLRLLDAATGKSLRTHLEAEEEISRLLAELDRLRSGRS